ncbi:hypothetical protein M892_14865 [Vibrio campbellii ATCC BAA-1116]|uniref:YqcC-like domain-containing protein n=2 Tax=Vibrionaceae TaxID=641 RepID=A7N1W7_VIBC1|nr:hypothetical protein VIBHAR_03243 [Vibrio campbellii ATCC BAA-1116]AGU95541.1 hypothetical protein M892_14865 [Vibrio campbellii ATCC BAA-1116]
MFSIKYDILMFFSQEMVSFSANSRFETELMATNIQLVDLLQQLEAQLQHHELWQQTMPSAEALQSTEPFAIDTLHPHEWLQWIFIARMRALLESNQPLPRGFSIEPYFAEAWKQELHYGELLETIRTIDELCK